MLHAYVYLLLRRVIFSHFIAQFKIILPCDRDARCRKAYKENRCSYKICKERGKRTLLFYPKRQCFACHAIKKFFLINLSFVRIVTLNNSRVKYILLTLSKHYHIRDSVITIIIIDEYLNKLLHHYINTSFQVHNFISYLMSCIY